MKHGLKVAFRTTTELKMQKGRSAVLDQWSTRSALASMRSGRVLYFRRRRREVPADAGKIVGPVSASLD